MPEPVSDPDRDRYGELRAELRLFELQFKAAHGRKLRGSDKPPAMRAKYAEYAALRARFA